MSDRKRLYHAHIHDRASETEGIGIFTTFGELTECGQWVEQQFTYADARQEKVRHAVSGYWADTPEKAMAAKAAKIRAIGHRLIRQADELEQAAQQQ